MRVACFRVALLACLLVSAQAAASTFNLRGNLQLVDLPPAATPVEAMLVSLHPLDGGSYVQAQPDHDGNFQLKNLRPGRYALALPMPGRLVTYARGGQNLSPGGFRLEAGGAPPLRIVVSMKSSELFVKVSGLPGRSGGVIALLAPADPRLALQFSCYSRTLTGPETEFRHVPPGRYRIFIIPTAEQSQVSAYAPRFSDSLKEQATTVEVLEQGEAHTTATYIDAKTVEQAIRRVGPIR